MSVARSTCGLDAASLSGHAVRVELGKMSWEGAFEVCCALCVFVCHPACKEFYRRVGTPPLAAQILPL